MQHFSFKALFNFFLRRNLMAQQKLTTVTNELIESYGNTAKNVINAYRVGNERAVVFMDERFVAALDKAGSRLSSPQTPARASLDSRPGIAP